MRGEKIRIVARSKIFLDRARPWLSYVQLVMIGILFIDKVDFLKRLSLGYPVLTYFFCALATLVGSVFIGYLDTRLGIRREEFRDNSEENPVLMDIVDRLDRIEKKNLRS
jgi:hypothetical protein